MFLTQFPDLQWLKTKAETNFRDREGWQGRELPRAGWPTVILNATASNIYRDKIRGPLSIFMNVSGESRVEVAGRSVCVREDFFFTTNQGQHYTLQVDKDCKTETFNIHFGDYFADEVFAAVKNTPEKFLDTTLVAPFDRMELYNKLSVKDDHFKQLIRQLKECHGIPLREEEILFELMAHVLGLNHQLYHAGNSLSVVRKGTRDEIMKRLLQSTDFIYECYASDIALEQLASVACLSKFHYLRLFKRAFQQTPHQFLNAVKISKGRDQLRNSTDDVGVIAQSLGFKDASSFSRLFYQHVGMYPSQFRLAARR